MRRNWAEQEIGYLINNWDMSSLNSIMEYLGRSQDSIIRKARRLGLNVCKVEEDILKKKWSSEEDQAIIGKYKELTPKELSQLLDRSVCAVKKRAATLGVANTVSRWTPTEEEYLKEKWGIYNIDTVAKKLNRSRNSVLLKAYQMSLRDQVNANGLFFTPSEISEILNVNIRTIYSWLDNGLIRYKVLRVGKRAKYQISVDYFCEFIENYQNKWNAIEADIDLIRSYYVTYALVDEGNLTFKEESTRWLEEKVSKDKHDFKKLMKPWTTKEERELINMVKEGFTHQEICLKLGRSIASTKAKTFLLRKREYSQFNEAI